MATYKTTGLVIGRTNLGEADRIITIMTDDRGKLRAVARGVKKIKSRLAGHIEPFSRVELMLAEGRSLDVITSAQLLWYPHSLTQDFAKLSRAFMIAAMLDRLTEEHLSQPELLASAQETLDGLETGVDPALAELYFKLRLLAILGYQPQLEHCAVCHSSDQALSWRLSPERGGLVDSGCSSVLDPAVDARAIKLWRLCLVRTLDGLAQVEGAMGVATNSLDACDRFYEYHFGRSFRPNLEAMS